MALAKSFLLIHPDAATLLLSQQKGADPQRHQFVAIQALKQCPRSPLTVEGFNMKANRAIPCKHQSKVTKQMTETEERLRKSNLTLSVPTPRKIPSSVLKLFMEP